MNLSESLRVAWEALVANKLRALLTMLGIVIGVGSVVAIIGLGRGATSAATSTFTAAFGPTTFRIWSMPGGGSGGKFGMGFTDDDIRRLRAAVPEIKAISGTIPRPEQVKIGTVTDVGSPEAFSAEGLAILGIKVGQGRPFTAEEDRSGRRVAIIGPYWASRFPPGVDPVGQTVYLNGTAFQVIGVQESFNAVAQLLSGGDADRSIYVPAGAMAVGLSRSYPFVYAAATDTDSVQAAIDAALDLLHRLHPQVGYRVDSVANSLQTMRQVIGIVTAVISAVAGISLVVGGIGIMNIMLVSVTERTREIGIRKAVGARRRDILLQFLIEAMVICLVGGILGVLAAAIPLVIAAKVMGIAVPVSFGAVALALAFSASVGLLFGVYPANKAARLSPIEALRYE